MFYLVRSTRRWSVLTHRFSLDQAEEAFQVALDRSGSKVEFIPG